MNDVAIGRLIVLDWDGTVMDSAAQIVAAMRRTMHDLGLPPRPDVQLRDCIGLGLDDALWRLFPELEASRVRAVAERYGYHFRRSDSPPAPLFPGAAEALECLGKAGYRLAVATGKSRRGLDRALGQSGLGPLFAATRCADECLPKPHPDMIEELLWETGCEPEQALMVGDTEFDMAMAGAAGVPSVGVACGVHDGSRLKRAGARAVLPTLAALPEWLRGGGTGPS